MGHPDYSSQVILVIMALLVGIAVGHWITRHVAQSVAKEIKQAFNDSFYISDEEDERWIEELDDWKDK